MNNNIAPQVQPSNPGLGTDRRWHNALQLADTGKIKPKPATKGVIRTNRMTNTDYEEIINEWLSLFA